MHISKLLQIPLKRPISERRAILGEFTEHINGERGGKKYPKLAPRYIAIKVAHIPTKDLYYLMSICKDGKNRNGSFGKVFFGALKVKK